jgi:hypothetical protein
MERQSAADFKAEVRAGHRIAIVMGFDSSFEAVVWGAVVWTEERVLVQLRLACRPQGEKLHSLRIAVWGSRLRSRSQTAVESSGALSMPLYGELREPTIDHRGPL